MRKSEQGFTMIELASVIIISGMIMLIVMQSLLLYYRSLAREHTNEAIATTADALSEFVATNYRYPCPASYTAPPGSEQYGQEACDGVTVTTGRDGQEILIGAVPHIFLQTRLQNVPLAEVHSYDGHGNRLTYAVTRSMTDPLLYNDGDGAIDVVDEFDQNVLSEPETAHYVVISHGENGVGAYTRDGQERAPGSCAAGSVVTPPTGGVITASISEIENCDGDGKFLSGRRILNENYYNDDQLRFVLNRSSNLWTYVGPTHIRNTNMGNVGMGVVEPLQRLHVAGSLRALRVGATKICDSTDNSETGCMPVEALAGEILVCPPGQAMYAIENNQPRCREIFTDLTSYIQCPPGTAAIGINELTGFDCAPTP